ncbi:protein of unknown function [Streptomyces murinus]
MAKAADGERRAGHPGADGPAAESGGQAAEEWPTSGGDPRVGPRKVRDRLRPPQRNRSGDHPAAIAPP